jgi:hypothetical protein
MRKVANAPGKIQEYSSQGKVVPKIEVKVTLSRPSGGDLKITLHLIVIFVDQSQLDDFPYRKIEFHWLKI